MVTHGRVQARRQHPSGNRVELGQQCGIAHRGRRHDGAVESPVGSDRAGLMLGRKIQGDARHEARRLRGVLAGDRDHRGDVDGIVLGVPAIEVRHHGNRRVGDLGLAGEFGLRHRRHADHVVARPLVGQRFGIGRELRSLDAHVGPALAERRAFGIGGLARSAPAAAARPGAPWGHARRSPGRRTTSPAGRCGRRYWSTSTNRPGRSSARNEPQAETEMRSVTPARLSTSILAR